MTGGDGHLTPMVVITLPSLIMGVLGDFILIIHLISDFMGTMLVLHYLHPLVLL